MHPKRAPDAPVAIIAGRQHGVVSIEQLRRSGISDTAVRERLRNGRLHRMHRGVYAVGHVPQSSERRWMAATLALGEGAVLSHISAAALWGLLRPREGPIDVSLPTRGGRRRRQGIRIHRPLALESQETTRRRGIPVTSPARTLRDLRRAIPEREFRRAVRQADVLGLPTGPEIASDRTRSELEHEFLQLCSRHGIPAPEVNAKLGRLTIDFLWAAERLVVETDGFQYHRGRVAFEDDHARDLELRALGYEVRRFSHRQVVHEPRKVAVDLRRELAQTRRAR
jgi:Transcriptional regulator, AbiEi antitoxin/Protein of unknown function (DUF559)